MENHFSSVKRLTVFHLSFRADNYKFYYFQFQRAISPNIGNPELPLSSACLLMMFYIDMQAGCIYQGEPSVCPSSYDLQ